MNPKMILIVLGILLAAFSYWVPQTLGAGVILIGAAALVPAA